MLAQCNEPALVYNFGGRDNHYNEHTLGRPTSADVRNLMQAAGIAIAKSLELEAHYGSHGGEERSLLAQLGKALGVVPSDPVADTSAAG